MRAGSERPKPPFWLFSIVGAAAVAGFALTNSGFASLAGDSVMVAAVLLCGLGYGEGARLARRLSPRHAPSLPDSDALRWTHGRFTAIAEGYGADFRYQAKMSW